MDGDKIRPDKDHKKVVRKLLEVAQVAMEFHKSSI